jgi:hypothetical protein
MCISLVNRQKGGNHLLQAQEAKKRSSDRKRNQVPPTFAIAINRLFSRKSDLDHSACRCGWRYGTVYATDKCQEALIADIQEQSFKYYSLWLQLLNGIFCIMH